jgi:hypothetical protein
VKPADIDIPPLEPLDLIEQDLRIDDDAVPDRAGQPRIEDSGRDQVKAKLLAVPHDRVTRVVAALKTDYEVDPLGEEVGDLSFAFIAPLGADYHGSRHGDLV